MTDAESNCFQWLEDLRVLFIEDEDEQRATIPENGPTIAHGKEKQREVQILREKIKSIGLQLKGLDSKSISDVCKGQTSGGTDEITFALYGKEDKLLKFARSNQSWYDRFVNKIKENYDYSYKKTMKFVQQIGGMSATLFGSVYTLLGYASGSGDEAVGLVAVLIGFAILLTNAPKMPKREREQIVQEIKKELSRATKIKNIDIRLVEAEGTYEFRVIVQRKSLVEKKMDALAKPTRRPAQFKF